MYKSLDVILREYNKAGYDLENIWCDSEFKSIMSDTIDNSDVKFRFCAPGDHVPDIERSNRVIEERFRVAFYRLSFRVIPRVMTEFLTMVVTKNLNIFPNDEGISKHYLP